MKKFIFGFGSALAVFGKVSDFISGDTRVLDNGDIRVTSPYYIGRAFLVSTDNFFLVSSDDKFLVSEGTLMAGDTRVTSRSSE